jgi:hypothetical protein
MRFFIQSLLLLIIASTPGFAQTDSTATPRHRAVNIHLVNGINFISDKRLQESYNLTNLYFIGAGLRVNESPLRRFTTGFDVCFSNNGGLKELLRINQFIPNIALNLLQDRQTFLRVKSGLLFTYLIDDTNKLNDNFMGFRMGLSLENNLWPNTSVHLDIDYDRMGSAGATYPRYNLLKVSMGMYL